MKGTTIFLLFLFGGLGTLSRYGLGRWLASNPLTAAWGHGHWGTAIINILGGFGFGLVTALLTDRFHAPHEIRIAITTGFFGAFTTFSTYIFETQQLVAGGSYLTAIGSFILQNGLGVAALLLGLYAGGH